MTRRNELDAHSLQGFLTTHRLVIKGAEVEEYLLVSGVRGNDASLNPEAAERLFAIPGYVKGDNSLGTQVDLTRLQHEVERHRASVIAKSAERNGDRLREERKSSINGPMTRKRPPSRSWMRSNNRSDGYSARLDKHRRWTIRAGSKSRSSDLPERNASCDSISLRYRMK